MLLDELVQASEEAYKNAAKSIRIPDWVIERLVAGVKAALQAVPVSQLPSVDQWKRSFSADVGQTFQFIGDHRWHHNTVPEGIAAAVADVCAHWKKQAALVCEQPELLARPYQERARLMEAQTTVAPLAVA